MQVTTYTLSDAAKSHTAFARATLFQNGVEQTTALEVLSGSVNVDSSAAVRRRCTLKLRGYHPELDPFTSEIKLWRSVNDEYVPLGVFRIEDPSFSEDRQGPITELQGFDRSYFVSMMRLPHPYSIAADGTANLIHNAILNLIRFRAGGLSYDFLASAYAVPATTFEEQSDPWEKAQDLAASGGLELFFDVNGVCVLRPIAGVSQANVVATFGSDARVLAAARKLSTKATYSRAIVTGENTNVQTPIRAEAVDSDPTSRTYYLGSFGDRPTWLRSQFITTQDQAQSAANALLARSSGRAEVVSFETIPNPAFDAGDVVSIYRPEIGVDAIHVLDTLDIPLEVDGVMSATTRERRIT